MQNLNRVLIAAAGLAVCGTAGAQEREADAGMIRFPDISASQIVFSYANDLWLVDREGGQARPLASPPGVELFPRFSPDGSMIGFQGNYDGDRDLYTVPTSGGTPYRVTHHPANETLTGWTPDGKMIFHSNGEAGLTRNSEIFTVAPEGGLPEKLPIPYGQMGAVSDDGAWVAYTPINRDFRTWKRYRGGMASDIWLFNIETLESRQITDWEGTDSQPMWNGDSVYYISDAGPNHRLNIWRYDVSEGDREQVTEFEDYDVKFPAIGPGPRGRGEIVFTAGPSLYRLELRNGRVSEVPVTVPGARPKLRSYTVDASENITSGDISSTGKRVVVEARGDIWTVPAETGVPRQLTDTSGAAERSPSWSPDGRWISYFSDATGEYELYVTQSDGKGETRQLTEGNETYFMSTAWSPDSKKMAVMDKGGKLFLVTVEDGSMVEIDQMPSGNPTPVSWSPDSRWMTYSRSIGSFLTSAVHIYDTQEGATHVVTSGFFSDTNPTFGMNGEFLYYTSNRDFGSPTYEDVGNTFVYDDTTKLIVVPLREDIEHPMAIEIDEEGWEDEESEADEETDEAAEEEGEGGDDAEAEAHPLAGTWSGTASGFAAIGSPEDEIQFNMYFRFDEEGNLSAASKNSGEVNSYDSAEWDEDSMTVTLTRSQGPVEQTIVATLSDGEMTGTWTITGALDASGPMNAEKSSDEIEDEDDIFGGEGKKRGKDDPVDIDLDGFERRGFEAPVESGTIFNMASNDKGHIMYMRFDGGAPSLKVLDISAEDPEEKTVVSGIGAYAVSSDGKKAGVFGGGATGLRIAVISTSPGQNMSSTIDLSPMNKRVNPREEWQQLVRDAWRRQRDFFYVENMHGVDWDQVLYRYQEMLDHATSREDVGFIIAEMISELNIGHAYYGGGDLESQPSENVGLLGAQFEVGTETNPENDEQVSGYRFSHIYDGAAWDTDARGPLTRYDMDVEAGDYLLSVDGRRLTTDTDPWQPFIGLAGRKVTITVADALVGDEEARNERSYVVQLLGNDVGLRYRDWVEANRQYVEEASDGRIGYIYVPNTGVQGQNELFRQFYAQIGKDALIIDDRWNGGGQIPDRFIELLNRPRTNYWARRDGVDWPWPYASHQGPKAMLINGSAGSGGDMFPWLFRHNEIGKLIGRRTWGGLVGITGMPALIDGGFISVPNFGFYETDGTWGVEGHGVDPDIDVIDNPTELANGRDPQMDVAIEHLLEELETKTYSPPARPESPDRSGMGIPVEDY